MNKINKNEVNNMQFSAVKIQKTAGNEAAKMEKLIKTALEDLLKRAEREVPEYGSFKNVSEKFKNTDKNLVADEFKIEIFQPPKGVENYETKRALRFSATKPGSDSSMAVLIEDGTKDDIIAKLKDGKLLERLLKETKNLSYHLEDL